jgi:predicted O-methyltransferase YrrM
MAFKPRNIIEIGSGFSSALMLDINGMEFNNEMSLTFIDPNPEHRLNALIRDEDRKSATIIKSFIQDVDLSVFDKLSANDILFVDNSHVSKTGSDVNHTFFEIFPRLKKGTLIHIHDVFNGFMYPKEWIFDMKANWNEIFLCRAFLMYNTSFEILLFPDYLQNHHPEAFNDFPHLQKSRPQSIWLRKID